MKTYLRILAYVRPYRLQVVLYSLATIGTVVFSTLFFVLLQPLLAVVFQEGKEGGAPAQAAGKDMAQWLDRFIAWILEQADYFAAHYGPSAGLLLVTAILVGSNIIGNIFRFFSSFFLGTLRTKVVEDLRRDAYNSLVKQSVSSLENARKGDLMARVTSDIVEVEHSVVTSFESVIRDPLNILYVLYLMFAYSWELTLFIFLVLPISAIIVSRITKALKRDAIDTQSTFGYIMSVADETVSGTRIIKAFNAEGYIRAIFNRFNQRYSLLTRRQWHRRALVPIFSESLMMIVVGLVLWFGGRMVFSGEIKASEFIAYIGLFYVITRPVKALSGAFGTVHKGIASGERIFALIDAPVHIPEDPKAKPVEDFAHSLEIRNVGFAYGKDPVLKDVSLTVPKGKVFALVGPSGSGKSTLAELLLRFYDPQQGSILLDGRDLRNMRLQDLRRLTAVVTQEPILFNDTFYNNIAFGMEGVTEEDVIAAARAANAHDFIMATEQGYQTNVGDRGGLLSGGQRQRISIARAVLKNPPILILDEATSALDTQSEKIVQDALYRLMAQRTSIVIAHRLSTIQDADCIVVLEHGQIAEQGTHTELLQLNGIYANLYRLQLMES